MARQREFDHDQVLEKAMLLFWEQGYEATSVRDLNRATGISSSSMYEFFGDKRGLFLASLKRFCAMEQANMQQLAQASATPHEFIRHLFASVDLLLQAKGQAQGSFAFNAMSEFSIHDPDIAAQLLDHYLKIAAIIENVVQQAQAANTIRTKVPPAYLAHTILTSLQGVLTVKGVKPDFIYVDGITQTLLGLLDK